MIKGVNHAHLGPIWYHLSRTFFEIFMNCLIGLEAARLLTPLVKILYAMKPHTYKLIYKYFAMYLRIENRIFLGHPIEIST